MKNSIRKSRKTSFGICLSIAVICIVVAVLIMAQKRRKVLSDQLCTSISSAITDHYDSITPVGSFTASDYSILDITCSNDTLTVYAIVYYSQYTFNGKEPYSVLDHYGPAIISFESSAEDSNSVLEAIEYWEPRRGIFYEEDVNSKLSRRAKRKATDTSALDILKHNCTVAAEEYYSRQPRTKPISYRARVVGAAGFETIPISSYCLNAGMFNADSDISNAHLPVFLIRSGNDMDRLRDIYETTLRGSELENSFPLDMIDPTYDDNFFSNHSLLVSCVDSSIISSHTVKGVYVSDYGSSLYMTIVQTNDPEFVPAANGSRLIIAEICDNDINCCFLFDSYLIGIMTDDMEHHPNDSRLVAIDAEATVSEKFYIGNHVQYYRNSLNKLPLMTSMRIPQRIPVFVFDSRGKLKQFCDDSFDLLYDDNNGYVYTAHAILDELLQKYTEDFFDEHSLILAYIWTPFLDSSYSLNSVLTCGQQLYLYLQQNDPGETEHGSWSCFATVEVRSTDISDCAEFDAVLIDKKTDWLTDVIW